MALVKQLVPDTIAHLLVRLGKEEERGGRNMERVILIFVAVQFSILSTWCI